MLAKKIQIFALGLAGVLAAMPLHAQIVMKMGSATINDVQHEWLRRFEADLKSRVGEKIKTEIYPSSQLGPIPRMVEGVSLGTIEAFVTPTSFLVSTESRFEIFDAPGLFESPAHLNRVLADENFRRRALAFGEAKGIKGVGIFYNSPVIVLSKRPIKMLDDFKGKKIRVFATPLQIEPIRTLGGSPVPMPLSEVMPALQNGTIDGMLAGIPVLTAMKFFDAAKYITEIHPAIVVSTLVVNKKWFDGLPAESQKAVADAAAKVDRDIFTVASGIVEKSNKAWTASGGELLKLPPGEQAKMMSELRALGAKLLAQNAGVKAEYDELLKVVERTR